MPINYSAVTKDGRATKDADSILEHLTAVETDIAQRLPEMEAFFKTHYNGEAAQKFADTISGLINDGKLDIASTYEDDKYAIHSRSGSAQLQPGRHNYYSQYADEVKAQYDKDEAEYIATATQFGEFQQQHLNALKNYVAEIKSIKSWVSNNKQMQPSLLAREVLAKMTSANESLKQSLHESFSGRWSILIKLFDLPNFVPLDPKQDPLILQEIATNAGFRIGQYTGEWGHFTSYNGKKTAELAMHDPITSNARDTVPVDPLPIPEPPKPEKKKFSLFKWRSEKPQEAPMDPSKFCAASEEATPLVLAKHQLTKHDVPVEKTCPLSQVSQRYTQDYRGEYARKEKRHALMYAYPGAKDYGWEAKSHYVSDEYYLHGEPFLALMNLLNAAVKAPLEENVNQKQLSGHTPNTTVSTDNLQAQRDNALNGNQQGL